VERATQVAAVAAAVSTAGFADRSWLVATVPGTVLTSFVNAGALPDPNFSDNQLMISDSYFHSDFWYRTEFEAPAVQPGRRLWLNLDGINWKADVWLNGAKVGRIEGAFLRGRYDVTAALKPGRNALAVRVEKLATPGSIKEKTYESPDKNGGAPGADNPTYHASIGWDWIPTIRGRDTGIWNDVYLTSTGAVSVSDATASSKLPLPDTSKAAVTLEATLKNHTAAAVTGTVRGRFGDLAFTEKITLPASGEKKFTRVLDVDHPKLWWPTGYGDPYLYPVELKFEDAAGNVSDGKAFQSGVRQFTYGEEGGALRMWINGRRFVPRGGNWGFPESMLLYRGREYDAAVRYHRDMNFTMIRNWVGQTGDDEFYEACDRHGIVVMQDFWLANPWDGPDPDDNAMFLSNVRDTVLRIRSHPSIGLYCGRNEGYPPKPLEDGIRAALAMLHPGIQYIPSSADDVVSGHGPYRAQGIKAYFEQRATPKFHSEMGMPNIMTLDSLLATFPEAEAWPQGRLWGLHDFCLTGAQGGASFLERIEKSYGGAKNLAEFATLAQFVNYEGHRAMFEAQSKNRMGLLIWMSHPAWPSNVWQTYDYFLEPTAGYFGAKKASEPLHVQWNAATDNVEVVNYSAGEQTGLAVKAEVIDATGVVKWQQSATVDSPEDSVKTPVKLVFPDLLTPVHFVRLTLSKGGRAVSDNFYWRGTTDGDFRALRNLAKVRLDVSTTAARQGGTWKLTTEVTNSSRTPAVLVRLKAVRGTTGDRILPALYSDNYVSIMPGETKRVEIEVNAADARGEEPRVAVEGFNVSGVAERR
jgi:beta-galactosidase/beta-glucuronidase